MDIEVFSVSNYFKINNFRFLVIVHPHSEYKSSLEMSLTTFLQFWIVKRQITKGLFKLLHAFYPKKQLDFFILLKPKNRIKFLQWCKMETTHIGSTFLITIRDVFKLCIPDIILFIATFKFFFNNWINNLMCFPSSVLYSSFPVPCPRSSWHS